MTKNGCEKIESEVLGEKVIAETCVCRGNLCNSASQMEVNIKKLLLCLVLRFIYTEFAQFSWYEINFCILQVSDRISEPLDWFWNLKQ